MSDRSQTLVVWRREDFLLNTVGFIAKHLFVFTPEVSQYHAYDNRRPNQVSGLIIGPCDISGYALAGYSSWYGV
jgi:hypothetical protein